MFLSSSHDCNMYELIKSMYLHAEMTHPNNIFSFLPLVIDPDKVDWVQQLEIYYCNLQSLDVYINEH